MKLQSARELKQEFADIAETMFVEQEEITSRTLRHRSIRVPPAMRARPLVAFGVAPLSESGKRKSFSFAVRVAKGADRRVAPILKKLSVPEKELDIVRGVDFEPRVTVRPGGSCGHPRITAGTLGGFVEDEDDYYILSNNHVLADSDRGREGDPTLMPGPLDATEAPRVVGRLARWIPLQAGTFDAALARVSDDTTFIEPYTYEGVGETSDKLFADRYDVYAEDEPLNVVKLGRTTGVTHGKISAFELDGISISFGSPVGTIRFNDVIEVIGHPDPREDFSAGGDSGSWIFHEQSKRPLALLFGGGPDADGIDRTLAHFITDVMDALRVKLVR